MLYLKSFTFNPFAENTYVLYTEERSAWIIDPGNSTASENRELEAFIREKDLRPEKLLLTHAHLDHVLGNRFVHDTYGLLPHLHREDLFFIEKMKESAQLYGVPCEQSPEPSTWLDETSVLYLGKHEFRCFHTPGHSPGSISFYNAKSRILLCGDVLFNGSIGRSDLPRGDHETLIASIRSKLLVLPDDVRVYSGHGPSTTIGHERRSNPFLT